MRRFSLLLLALLALVAVGCGGDDDSGDGDDATTPSSTGCRTVAQPAPKGEQDLRRPTTRLTGPTRVRLTTNCGTITIQLAVDRAPKTASSFASLVRRGFYDGLTFHRVSPGFVVQGGDPLGTGFGGSGYTVVERPPSNLRYTAGTVAMAKAADEAPGTSSSQFFIVTAEEADNLEPVYALVGRVVAGSDTVRRLEATPIESAETETPTEPLVIERAQIVAG